MEVMSATVGSISKAIVSAQKKMSTIVKDERNPFFKSRYATLNAVREACVPALNDQGVAIMQPIVQKEGKSYVRTLALHESGEFMGSDTEVVCAKANDPQAYGSAISYARRYGLQAFMGLASSDDDGEAAMGRSAPVSASAEASPAPAAPSGGKGSSFRRPGAPKAAPAAGAPSAGAAVVSGDGGGMDI